MRPLDQQTVLITGATDGLGRALADRYFNGEREAEPQPQAHDREARRRLRELSDQLCSL